MGQQHNEAIPHSGLIGQAAQSVAAHCLLPDPRSKLANAGYWFIRTITFGVAGRATNHQSEERCIANEIAGKAGAYQVPAPAKGSPDYEHIMRHARSFAAQDAAICKVRDFNDRKDEPQQYFGYRDGKGQCQVTHDEQTARNARAHYPQQPPQRHR